MNKGINTTDFQEGLLELSKDTTDKAGTGGSKQELELDFSLIEALEELSNAQANQRAF